MNEDVTQVVTVLDLFMRAVMEKKGCGELDAGGGISVKGLRNIHRGCARITWNNSRIAREGAGKAQRNE